jgi:transposase
MAYSLEIRKMVIESRDRGNTLSSIAEVFGISLSTINKIIARWTQHGDPGTKKMGNNRKSILVDMRPVVLAWLKEKPDLTLRDITNRLAIFHKIIISVAGLWNQFKKWRFSYKKKELFAMEQLRPDVVQRRADWVLQRQDWDLKKLVGFDETCLKTNMTPRCGWSPIGEPCIAYAPHNHYIRISFICAITSEGPLAPWTKVGSFKKADIIYWVKERLCPFLKPGQIVFCDNLSSHKAIEIKNAIEAAGATIKFQPQYSPDVQPSEKLFETSKTLLRKAEKRTVLDIESEILKIVNEISKEECIGYFEVCGYVSK